MQKYNRITVLEDLGLLVQKDGRKKRMVQAKCDCGKVWNLAMSDVKNGRTKSCGCYGKELRSAVCSKHNLIKHPLYRVWGGMKGRCSERDWRNRKDYFDKGIQVCEDWVVSFKCFYDWAIGNGYKKGLQIDRKDNNKGYSPDNCRFVTATENSNNRERTRFLTLNDTAKPLTDWARELSIDSETLRRRVDKYKWSDEKALTTNKRIYKN